MTDPLFVSVQLQTRRPHFRGDHVLTLAEVALEESSKLTSFCTIRIRVSDYEAVKDIEVALGQVGAHLLEQMLKHLWRGGDVPPTPPYSLLRLGFTHEKLRLRRATGALPSSDDKSSVRHQETIATMDTLFHEFRDCKIPIDLPSGADSEATKRILRHNC